MKNLSELTNEELWQLFPIILSEHKEQWEGCYLAEKKILLDNIGGNNIFRIHHIGSTAVSGLLAKPTIDILIEIQEGMDLEKLTNVMQLIGYIYNAQPKNPPPHMIFMKGYTMEGFEGQVFHVHVRYSGDWDELYFRDYLLSHPEMVREYGELKIKLQEQYEHDRDSYTNGKTIFIRKITALAKEKFKGRYAV